MCIHSESSLFTWARRRPEALQTAATALVVRVPVLEAAAVLGVFLWCRLGQEQRSKQEAAVGLHPDGACRLGAYDRRTSGHSAFATFPGNQRRRRRKQWMRGHRIPRPLQKPGIYPQHPVQLLVHYQKASGLKMARGRTLEPDYHGFISHLCHVPSIK